MGDGFEFEDGELIGDCNFELIVFAAATHKVFPIVYILELSDDLIHVGMLKLRLYCIFGNISHILAFTGSAISIN